MLPMKQWYALYTKVNSEEKVATALQQRGIETYLPQTESTSRNGKRKVAPFFPCYLFIRVDVESVGPSVWQWTPGLYHVVAFGNRPVPVADQVIELIKRSLDQDKASQSRPGHLYKPGDVVRVTRGPLADMLAIFEGPTTPSERVCVLLNFLNRTSRVRLDVHDLEKASANDVATGAKRPRRTRGRGRPVKSCI